MHERRSHCQRHTLHHSYDGNVCLSSCHRPPFASLASACGPLTCTCPMMPLSYLLINSTKSATPPSLTVLSGFALHQLSIHTKIWSGELSLPSGFLGSSFNATQTIFCPLRNPTNHALFHTMSFPLFSLNHWPQSMRPKLVVVCANAGPPTSTIANIVTAWTRVLMGHSFLWRARSLFARGGINVWL